MKNNIEGDNTGRNYIGKDYKERYQLYGEGLYGEELHKERLYRAGTILHEKVLDYREGINGKKQYKKG